MARRKVHAPALTDDRRLQRLGERDEMRDPGRGPRCAIGDDHRVLRVDQQPRGFGTAPESPCGGVATVSFGMRRRELTSCEIGSSCRPPSMTSSTGIIGGVIAIL
jgi:hypothetical protein